MSFLLDTNVVSQSIVMRQNANVLRWLSFVDEEQLFISAITVRDLWYGLEKRRLERAPEDDLLRARVDRLLRGFQARIPTIDRDVAIAWASMLARSHQHIDDTGLAATAAVHGLVLVTRNVAHLRGRGVPVLDPLRSPAALIAPAT